MQNSNFVQLELPFFKDMNPLIQMQQAIQSMLDLTWNAVLLHISKPATKELLRQHGKLMAFSDGEAWVKVSSPQLFKLVHNKISELEAAFLKAFGIPVRIHLEA